MGILLRVAAALLIAVPLFVVLVVLFVLAGRRASLPSEVAAEIPARAEKRYPWRPLPQ